VRRRLALAAAAALALTPTSSAKEVGVTRPPVALQVSPARVALAAPGSRTIRLRNVGARQVVVDTARKALGPRHAANRWLTIAPRRLVLAPGSSAAFTLRAVPGPHAVPGDHHVLVLLVGRPTAVARVTVRMRLGIVVRVRVSGRIVRRLQLRGLRVRRHGRVRVLLASVANRGNVSEEIFGPVTISLTRGGHALARLRVPARRELRPGTDVVFRARYGGRVRGLVTAVVTVPVRGARAALMRTYRIRL
jgi:hypothetical protein